MTSISAQRWASARLYKRLTQVPDYPNIQLDASQHPVDNPPVGTGRHQPSGPWGPAVYHPSIQHPADNPPVGTGRHQPQAPGVPTDRWCPQLFTVVHSCSQLFTVHGSVDMFAEVHCSWIRDSQRFIGTRARIRQILFLLKFGYP